MHLQFWIFFTALFSISFSLDIAEPQTYEPTVAPSNVPQARAALGYDKYEKQPVQSSKSGQNPYPYGNNWEQFDVPQINYNFGYNG